MSTTNDDDEFEAWMTQSVEKIVATQASNPQSQERPPRRESDRQDDGQQQQPQQPQQKQQPNIDHGGALRDMAKALGLDPSLSVEDLVKQAHSIKENLEETKKAADWCHLLVAENLKDCTIQVNLPPSDDQPPPAKKAKIAAGKKKKGPKGSASTTTTTATKSVMAHSIILSSKSEYFKAVLSRGKWAESKTRTIEVDLPSEEALDAFYLLVELSYGTDYLHHPSDNSPLPRDTLLQLITVANMFKFMQCIEACCKEVRRLLDKENAMATIESLCHVQRPHQSIDSLIDHAISLLGPLEEFWSPGTFDKSRDDALNEAKCPKMQGITSVDMLIRILKSDSLVLYSENSTFTFMDWWLCCQEGWSDEQQQEAFIKLLVDDAIRFHCMDPVYLAAYAVRNPWMEKSGEGLAILQHAILAQEKARHERKEDEEQDDEDIDVSARKNEDNLPTSRALIKHDDCFNRVYRLSCSISRPLCATLKGDDECLTCFLGIVQGYPILLDVSRSVEEDDHGTKSARFGLYMGWLGGGDLVEPGRGHRAFVMMGANARVWSSSKIAGDGSKWLQLFAMQAMRENFFRGHHLFFKDVAWDAVVADGSPYFGPDDDIMHLDFKLMLKE